VSQLGRDPRPLPMATLAWGSARAGRTRCRRRVKACREAAIERDLDDRWRQSRIQFAGLAIRAAGGAGERIARPERVEYLAADASRDVRAERRARVGAIPARPLDEPEHAPGDEVFAIGAAAARIERARGDCPRESEVRDDAFVARQQIHSSLPGGTVSMAAVAVNNAVTGLSTIAEGYFVRYRYPYWLRAHSLVVGAIAARLAEAHAAANAVLDVRTVALGGYLHDIGKSPLLAGDARDHGLLGPLILAAEGLPELAELARRHPVYAPRDPATAPRTLAEKIVYYADRRGGLRVVTLAERIDEQVGRFPELARFRQSDLAMAQAIEAEVFTGIALRPEDLA
jgi:HD domain